MNQAIRGQRNWAGSNTTVFTDDAGLYSTVYLHGNHIATVGDSFMAIFDGGYQSNTTKSRLNALLQEFRPHTKVFAKNFQWFIKAHNTVVPFISGSLV